MSTVLRNGLRTACAAAAMTTAWSAAPAQAATFNGTVETNFGSALQDVYLLYGFNASGLLGAQAVLLSESVAAGPQQFPASFEFGTEWWNDLSYFRWTVIGIIEDVAAARLSVTMSDSNAQNALTNGYDWSDVFFSTGEAGVWDFVDLGNTGLLADWFASDGYWGVGSLELNDTGTQVNFSIASENGTARFVPEPATVALIGLGVIALAGRRRV